MRKFCVYFILLQVFLITDQSGSECLNQRYLAVSLKALQQALRSCTESGNCPDEYNMLGGLTKIDGYVIDNANGDVILYGESLPWKPPLYTEDFVVALRNAWVLYFTQKGNTKYYSNPGCSIDPRPDLHNRLNSVFSNLSRQSISGNDINKMKSQMRRQIEKFSKNWEAECRAPQDVVVLGIPRNTRFAQVIVSADYYMKKIANGSVRLRIDGFSSYMELKLADIKANPVHAGAMASTTRFWFYPGKNEYLEIDGILKIEKCPVTLLTELEYSSDKTDDDSMAKEFTRLFTEKYSEIAERRPTYYKQGGLFRHVAVAKLLKHKHLDSVVDLTYFLNEFKVPKVPVEKTVPGAASVHIVEVDGGMDGKYYLPSPMMTCGGVDIAIDIDPRNFVRREKDEGALADLRKKLLASKAKQGDVVSWQIPHHGNDVVVTRFTIDQAIEKDIESLIRELKKVYGAEAQQVNYFIKPSGENVNELYLVNDAGDDFFKAAIYDALQSFKMETPSISFAVVNQNESTYAIYSDKTTDGEIYKFKIHNSIIRFFWQKFLEKVNKYLPFKKSIEFVNIYKENFGEIIATKLGEDDVVAVLHRGKLPINFQQLYQNHLVVKVADHDVFRSEENLKTLLKAHANINYKKSRFISGVPGTEAQFKAVGVLNGQFMGESGWNKIYEKLTNSIEMLNSRTELEVQLEHGTLENFKRILNNEQIETVFIIAHHENGKMYFFDENNNQVVITTDHIKQWRENGLIKTKQIILISCKTGGRSNPFHNERRTITEEFIGAGVNNVLAPTDNIDALDSVEFLNGFLNRTTSQGSGDLRLMDIIKDEILKHNDKFRNDPSRILTLDHWVEIRYKEKGTNG